MEIKRCLLICLTIINLFVGGMLLYFGAPLDTLDYILLALGLFFFSYSFYSLPRSFHFRPNELVTTGAYALCRNPRYFGICLMNVGLLDFSIYNTLAVVLFIALWTAKGKHEEKELREMFGKKYKEYASKVSFYPLLKI